MLPLFDRNGDLVGWIDGGRHIYDENLDWRAYVIDGHAWSSNTGNWLGPVVDETCLDKNGHPVTWTPGQSFGDLSQLQRPPRASRIPRPPRPRLPTHMTRPAAHGAPPGGWSDQLFHQWLNEPAPATKRIWRR